MLKPSFPEWSDQFPRPKPRAHRNQGPQITPRWEQSLRFIAQQGAIRFDHLQRLLGHLSPDPADMKEPGVLSEERTRKILRRWQDEDLYEYRQFYVKQRGWLWLTRKGLKFANVSLRYYEPSPASLDHLAAVNAIRLTIEAKRPGDTWVSERELRAGQDPNTANSARRHVPDAELRTEKGTINAIEVELTIKSEKRLHDILLDLASNPRYSTIWYFAPDAVAQAVRRAIMTLPIGRRAHFRLYDLEGKEYAQ